MSRQNQKVVWGRGGRRERDQKSCFTPFFVQLCLENGGEGGRWGVRGVRGDDDYSTLFLYLQTSSEEGFYIYNVIHKR